MKQAIDSALLICSYFLHTANFFKDLVFQQVRKTAFYEGKKSLIRRGVILITPRSSSESRAVHRFTKSLRGEGGPGGEPGGLGGQESPEQVPGRAGGAGGGRDTMCAEVRLAVCPPQKKAAKLGYFGLKISGGNRESLNS